MLLGLSAGLEIPLHIARRWYLRCWPSLEIPFNSQDLCLECLAYAGETPHPTHPTTPHPTPPHPPRPIYLSAQPLIAMTSCGDSATLTQPASVVAMHWRAILIQYLGLVTKGNHVLTQTTDHPWSPLAKDLVQIRRGSLTALLVYVLVGVVGELQATCFY